jgi:hypothetical protein
MDLNALLFQKTRWLQRANFEGNPDNKVLKSFEREDHVISLLRTHTQFNFLL